MPGPVSLYPWQPTIVDSTVYFDEVYFIAAVQTFKSMAAEGIAAYYIDNFKMNQLWIYSKREKIEEVFDERIKPMVKDVPAIRKYWNGDDKTLTKKRIKLIHLICHIASAGIKDDIATHNAGIIIGDEWAKWPKKDFSQKKAVKGRQQASKMVGQRTKLVFCTSPDNDEDPSYIATHQPGILWFNPYHKCPHCNEWQYLVDSQIREIPNRKGEKDHDPVRIENEKAAWYECVKCKQEITESERFKASFDVKWLTKDKKVDFYDIIKSSNRPRKAVFQWNRLTVPTHTFVDQICDLFVALQSPDPNDLKTYRNEDNAEWVQLKADKYDAKALREKCAKYFMFGKNACVPEGVKVLFAGIDTQDDGFYYIVRGYGERGESWLLRADFIKCDKKDADFQNPLSVYRHFYDELHKDSFKKKDGTQYGITLGFIDRGGHRAEDVDTICRHMYEIKPYIGSTFRNSEKISKINKDGIVFGNTRKLALDVSDESKTAIWHLPFDIQDEYCDQFIEQYYESYVDQRGNKRKRWMSGDETGQADHYRDCENMCKGAFHYYRTSQRLDDISMDAMDSSSIIDTGEELPKAEEVLPKRLVKNVMSYFKSEMEGMGF